MMRKYKMSEEEILKIWDEFYAKHPDGFMSKESFLDTKEVKLFLQKILKKNIFWDWVRPLQKTILFKGLIL